MSKLTTSQKRARQLKYLARLYKGTLIKWSCVDPLEEVSKQEEQEDTKIIFPNNSRLYLASQGQLAYDLLLDAPFKWKLQIDAEMEIDGHTVIAGREIKVNNPCLIREINDHLLEQVEILLSEIDIDAYKITHLTAEVC